MTFRTDFSSKSVKSEHSHLIESLESLVPTPIFSGRDQFSTPTTIGAISFAPATIEFATPMTHGTLMSAFGADPQVLRDGGDSFPIENFSELVITWPGLDWEWKVPMSNVAGGRDRVSRQELAQFVVHQFNSLAFVTGAKLWSDPEWRLGEAPNAYSTKNTCLAFLFSPAPLVWQPVFRVRNRFQCQKSVAYSMSAPESPLLDIPVQEASSPVGQRSRAFSC